MESELTYDMSMSSARASERLPKLSTVSKQLSPARHTMKQPSPTKQFQSDDGLPAFMKGMLLSGKSKCLKGLIV